MVSRANDAVLAALRVVIKSHKVPRHAESRRIEISRKTTDPSCILTVSSYPAARSCLISRARYAESCRSRRLSRDSEQFSAAAGDCLTSLNGNVSEEGDMCPCGPQTHKLPSTGPKVCVSARCGYCGCAATRQPDPRRSC